MRYLIRTVLLFAAVLLIGVAGPAVAGRSPAAATGRGDTTDHVLSVLGAGPYRIGARLDSLIAAGLVDPADADPSEPGDQVTGVTGAWAGELLLTFRHGVLIEIETATDAVRTIAGARVGMSFAEVDSRYHGVGRLLVNARGDSAYVVLVGPMVMMFHDHPIRPGVGAIQVGPARITLRAFLDATDPTGAALG